jgi:hypothetical protein
MHSAATIDNIYITLGYLNLDEDDMQDIAIKCWEQLDKYDATKAALSTWVSTIAKNHIISKSRSFQYKTEEKVNPISSFQREGKDGVIYSTIDSYLVSDELNPLNGMIASEDIEVLANRIKSLSPAFQECLEDYIQGKEVDKLKFYRAIKALNEGKKKKKYLLINLHNGDNFQLNSLTEAANIAGCTPEAVRLASLKSGFFMKKKWHITIC